MNIPVIGLVNPQIDMPYDIKSLVKTVRIRLNDNNVMKYTLDGDKEGEDNHTAFKDDISKINKINAQVTLQNKCLKKIRADYKTVIDTIIDHVGSITEDKITKYIGGAANIDYFNIDKLIIN